VALTQAAQRRKTEEQFLKRFSVLCGCSGRGGPAPLRRSAVDRKKADRQLPNVKVRRAVHTAGGWAEVATGEAAGLTRGIQGAGKRTGKRTNPRREGLFLRASIWETKWDFG
jgi:hypothetical protein